VERERRVAASSRPAHHPYAAARPHAAHHGIQKDGFRTHSTPLTRNEAPHHVAGGFVVLSGSAKGGRSQIAVTFSACGPLGPCVTSN